MNAHPADAVRCIEHTWIPMPDGVRLSARIWLPPDAEERPVPALLEYIPYRKRDGTRARDHTMHPWFAAHGYASLRVDLRGSGDSEGILEDEYLQRELDDGVAVLAWLGRQPWCDGRVGMFGISWGGFNALQIAELRPPELGAVVSVCSTDDRYADDVHHMGGCLLGDNLSWASVMFAYTSLPPDPAIVGDRWREMWFERLEHCRPWLATWLRHPRRDAYWQHGSVAENYDAIRVPVLAASGWNDGYSNAVFRLMQHLQVPRAGLIGPWGHAYPHLGSPGPAIDFLRVCLRWWDRWLKGIRNGVDDEPLLRLWMQESVPPTTRYDRRPGRWIAERAWPAPAVRTRRYRLVENRLLDEADDGPEERRLGASPLPLRSPLPLGLFAGKWCSYSVAPDLPHDQRQEDGGALVFDTAPLDERLEVCGKASLQVELSADAPVAMLAVRLSDIRPSGEATRVTYGLLNLTHHGGDEHPTPLQPGRRYSVEVPLNAAAHAFPAGHRIRVALSSSYWPLAWPPPTTPCLHVHLRASRFELPVRDPRPEADDTIPAGPPQATEPLGRRLLAPPRHAWRVIRDLASDRSVLEVVNDDGRYRLPDADVTVTRAGEEAYTSVANDVDSVRGETIWERALERDGWSVRTVTRTVLTSDAERFYLRAELDAYEGDRRVFSRNWDETIPRDLV